MPAFRTRLENGKPLIYDVVHGSPTILRDDGGLAFSLLLWDEDFESFYLKAKEEIDSVKKQSALDASKDRPDTIYYSIIPWIPFTSVSHPLDLPRTQGVPILTFGKCFKERGRLKMPVAIHAHHALMDGLHVKQFFDLFRESMNRRR